jgi:hypothetical protein
MENENPQFPQYEPPAPKGVPVVERKISDPLWKALRMHLKPHKGLEKRPFLKHKKKVKVM